MKECTNIPRIHSSITLSHMKNWRAPMFLSYPLELSEIHCSNDTAIAYFYSSHS